MEVGKLSADVVALERVIVEAVVMETLLAAQRSLACFLLAVCASKRKTFVLVDDGSVYGFGWMVFGSLGFTDRGASDKITKPRVLESLRSHHISQVSTGLYHTVVVTNRRQIFGFGDNERVQLGHETLGFCLKPTEILIPEMENDANCVVSKTR